MKVVHVVHNYAPSVGGSQLLVQTVSERLVASYGDDVRVLTTNAMRSPSFVDNDVMAPGDEVIAGVRVTRYPFWRRPLAVLKRVLRAVGSGRLREYLEPVVSGPISPRMIRAISSSDADVIACMSFPFLHMYYPYLRRRSRRPRVVLIGALHLAGEHVPAPVLGAIARADAYIAFTEFEARALVANGADPARLHVIGLGVAVDEFATASGDELRRRHRIGSAPIVAFIGRQAPHKGCDTLLRAMTMVWDRNPEAYVVLAGSRTAFSAKLDAIAAALPAARRARVIAVDDFPEHEKAQWFAACDVFVSASSDESFGISFVEAWAAGKPVIGGKIGSTSCVVRDEVDGLLVPPGDDAALAAAIGRLLADPALRARFGKAGADKVRRENDWPAVVERFRRVYAGTA